METVAAHLSRRSLNLSLHTTYVDEENRVATFPLWNLSGQMVGYQSYRPEGSKKPHNHPTQGKYFTFRKQPTIGVWGVESLNLTPGVVFVTEGVFDGARITNRGVSALALLSNDPTTSVCNWLWMLSRKVVVVSDNDAAGLELAKAGQYVEVTSAKDLGASPEEYVTYLINKYV